MEKLAIIVVFTYRRIPDKLIESLRHNSLSKESNIIIFSDGYKNDLDKNDILEVREYLKEIIGFNSVKIIEANQNKGLANSIISGVTEVFNSTEKIIVLEDDLIVSDDFLEYMNKALDFYNTDEKIWSISGYGPNLPCLENHYDDLYLSTRGSSWGWATWKDRWDKVDWEVKGFDNLRTNQEMQNKFNLGGNDMYKMLELQMLGKIDSWAIRWCFSQFTLNKYTVFPKKTKIINDGFNDNKGTHNSGVYEKLSLEINHEKVKFKDLSIDNSIIKCFQKFHNLSLKTMIGYWFKKKGGYSFAKKVYTLTGIIK